MVRTVLAGGVLLVGFLLGGQVGGVTVLFACGVGPLVGWFLAVFTRIRASRALALARPVA